MTQPSFQFGQRCERAGHWRPDEGGEWVFGTVVAFSAHSLTLKNNHGLDVQVAADRATWKKSYGGWAIWAPWVRQAILAICEQEQQADRLGSGRLRLRPAVGDYVVVHKGAEVLPGFITRIEGEAVAVTRRTPDEQGRYRFALRMSALHWDDQYDFWRARSGLPQEKRNA